MTRPVYIAAAALLFGACAPELRDGQFLCATGPCPEGFECCSGVCQRECATGVDAGPVDAGERLDGGRVDSGGFDAGEPTDGGADAGRSDGGAADAGGDAGPCVEPDGYLMFVTSSDSDGDFSPAGPDDDCRRRAAEAGLARHPTTQAWLSTSTNPVSARFRSIDTEGPVRDICGRRVAATVGQLISGNPDIPIELDETRANVAPASHVWTGTGVMGTHTASCSDWMSTGGSGTIGLPTGTDATWIDLRFQVCNMRARLYCLRPGR